MGVDLGGRRAGEADPCRGQTGGLSLDMGAWRFNLRASNTEPLLWLNAESRGDRALLDAQVARLRDLIAG